MKTEIDWDNAPEGATHYLHETDSEVSCWAKQDADDKIHYITCLYHKEKHVEEKCHWIPTEDFIIGDLIQRPKAEAKPIYTQAMADNGELPGVGMECLVKRFHQNDSYLINGYIIGYSKDKCWLVFENEKDELSYNNIKNGTFTFKPLPVPIELIDGEKYEVEITFGDYRVGYYKKDRNSFFDGLLCSNKICGRSECTSVKLLKIA